MTLLFLIIVLVLSTCKEGCYKVDPAPDRSLGWFPLQTGNYWQHTCRGNECNGEGVTGYEVLRFGDFTLDSLSLFLLYPVSLSAYCEKVVGMSKNGQRLYSGCRGDVLAALSTGGVEAATAQLKLTLDFSLSEGDSFTGGYGGVITIESKTDNEIVFSGSARSLAGTYQKGLGLVQDETYQYEDIQIKGVVYSLKCR